MKNQALIDALVSANIVRRDEGEKLLKEADATQKSVEDVVLGRNVASEIDLAKLKASILKIPYKKVDPEAIGEELFRLIPRETMRSYEMVPLSREKGMLVVGMVNPDNVSAQEALRFLAKQARVTLGVYVVTQSDVASVLRRFSPFAEEIQAAVKSIATKGGDTLSFSQKIVKLDEGIASSTSEAPIIRIVASLLKEAVASRASDIHIEPQRDKTRVRFRIEGDLEEYSALPPELSQSMVARVKVLSNMRLDETRVPQDGRFRTVIFEKEIDFRVSTFPTPNGEKVALRVLDPEVGLKSLEEIGITGKNAELLTGGIDKPFGMILLTGPTGSGKTTTLYALMRILNKEQVNIVSLEDPVEYTISGVNQSQVRPEIGYDFASGLRQILRQDPDTIMVGEIRDGETAGLAVHAALTGHVVLSTLHTNNAVGVIPRLVDMGVSGFLLPSALNLMASQRLLSRICGDCKKGEPASPEIAAAIKRSLEKAPPSVRSTYREPYTIYHAPGCPRCRHKGIVGRIAVFEVFQMTPELTNIISSGDINENKILSEARRQGMLSLREDAVVKALQGLVKIEEVLRETEEV